jgi:hypothetical protein
MAATRSSRFVHHIFHWLPLTVQRYVDCRNQSPSLPYWLITTSLSRTSDTLKPMQPSMPACWSQRLHWLRPARQCYGALFQTSMGGNPSFCQV